MIGRDGSEPEYRLSVVVWRDYPAQRSSSPWVMRTRNRSRAASRAVNSNKAANRVDSRSPVNSSRSRDGKAASRVANKAVSAKAASRSAKNALRSWSEIPQPVLGDFFGRRCPTGCAHVSRSNLGKDSGLHGRAGFFNETPFLAEHSPVRRVRRHGMGRLRPENVRGNQRQINRLAGGMHSRRGFRVSASPDFPAAP